MDAGIFGVYPSIERASALHHDIMYIFWGRALCLHTYACNKILSMINKLLSKVGLRGYKTSLGKLGD